MGRRNTEWKGAWTPDVVRQRIQATAIMNRLTDHALGKIALTATQIRAAEILLRKTVPDLSAVEHSGEVAQRHYIVEVPAVAATSEQWQKQIEQEQASNLLPGVPSPAPRLAS